jgi:signal transduction histidine kinase
LGLAVTYNIVHRHGGEIIVETREHEGSCFTVRLPA